RVSARSLPAPGARPYTSLLVEVRADGFNIAASLRDATDDLRRIPSVVCVSLPFLEEAADALPAPDDHHTADAFDPGRLRLRPHPRDALMAAAATPGAHDALTTLLRTAAQAGAPLRIELDWSDDAEHLTIAQ